MAKFKPGQKVATGIFWQSEGTYSIQVSIGKREAGKTYYQKYYETFKGTVEEAKTRRAKIIIDYAEGRLKPIEKKKTFGEYAQSYFDYNRRRVELDKISQSTADFYEEGIQRNFSHLWDRSLARVDSDDIIDVFVDLTKRKASPYYILSIFRAWRAMWHASERLKIAVPDLVDDVAEMLLDPAKKHRLIYEPNDFKKLLKAAEDDPITHGILTASVCTLCRINEVLALGKLDTKIEQREVVITRQVLKKPGKDGNRFGPHKTFRKRGPRLIRMTDGLAEELQRLKPIIAAMQLRAGSRWQDHGLWFPTSIGTPFSYSWWERDKFKPLFEKAGLPPIRFHDIRHSAVTYLLSEGVSPAIVQEIAGHADIKTTMEYKHLLVKAQDSAMDKLDRAMR